MKLFASAAEMRAVPRSEEFRNGGVSLWYRDAGLPERRAALPGPADYDVCIVGAGFTGLWAAYYLLKADPSLRVAVLEREFAGFGASGRGGGLVTADFPGSREQHAREYGKGAMIALQRALMASVDEILGVVGDEGIDAGAVKGGMRITATNPAQKDRLHERVEHLQEWGYWPEDLHLVEHGHEPWLRVDGQLAAAYTPHAARLDPARLAAGLAEAVQRLGADVYEGTEVTGVRPREGETRPAALTPAGEVRADVVLRATEGYTGELGASRSEWAAEACAMIATEPLPEQVWEHIGWEGGQVLSDAAHSPVFAQRTADGRIALGGRGAPHRMGAGAAVGAAPPQAIAELWRVLARMFPAAAEVPVAHAWAGPTGVPADRRPRIGLDTATGLAWAGGYSGSGVALANLAGRTLRDLVLGDRSDLARLPWASGADGAAHPLRRLGGKVAHGLYRGADRRETSRLSTTSRLAAVASRITGHR